MFFLKPMVGAVALGLFATLANADGIRIDDPYFRTSGAMAKSGAAFMHIVNETETADRLISASSTTAKRVELHTHIQVGDGVMQMREVEDGFEIPAMGMHMLARGGDHVMFMGLQGKVVDGDIVTLTLNFENAGEVVIEVPVDLKRAADAMHTMDTDG